MTRSAAPKEKRPTDAQLRALRNLVEGKSIDDHCRTRSDYGGLSNTIVALHRAGWITEDGATGAGQTVLNKYGSKK